jgi:hypothetical protein
MAFIKAAKCRHWASTRSDIIKGTSLPRIRYLLRIQAPEMAGSSWMAKKYSRVMAYQWKAKDLVNTQEYLYGVANIVI